MSELETQMEECGVCHALHPMADLVCFDDTLVCPECMEDTTTTCGRCGERMWREDDVGNEDSGHLCQSCYDRYYNTCEECHRIICEEDAYYEDDDRVLCYDCHRRQRSRYSINDYSYKPDPIFYGGGPLYMGVELEIDEGGESDSNARKILEVANAQEELVYIKHDGSLSDGMEVVSHPMTLAYHMEKMPWKAVLEKAKQLGYLSHQAKTCGLHCHINRDALGGNIAEQEEVIARILYFFEKHWEELLKFSRRTHRQMEQWANRYGYKDSPMEILDHAKKGFRGFRYTAVNLTNAATLEFRWTRGTLRLTSFLATLQLIDRICAVAICLNDDELKQMSWSTFVAGCGQYPELVQYLKERRLYINEPVTAEAEV